MKVFVAMLEKIKTQTEDMTDALGIKENPFLAVVYQKKGFVDKFHEFDYENQIKAYQTLVKLASNSNANNESRADAMYKLQRIMESIGLNLVEQQDCSLTKDERMIIRMDFYGTIDRMQAGERKRKLSQPYLSMMSNPLKKRPKKAEYDFSAAPMWPLFARFKSFRKIENQLKNYLIRHKVDPKILTLMNVRDFSDLIVHAFEKNESAYKIETLKSLHQAKDKAKKYFANHHMNAECLSVFHEKAVSKINSTLARSGAEMKIAFEKPFSVRKNFVMSFVSEHEDQISDILLKQGYDKRYVISMLNAMKKYGATKTDKLVITETHFTDQILKDFKRVKIDCKDFKKGEPIPQVLIDYLIEAQQGELIAARDENGRKLCSSAFPSFEVHHKHAVSNSADLPNIASINYKDNLCLVFTEIHTFVLHGMDIIEDNKRDAYSRRTEFLKEDIAFMAGFEDDKQISCPYFYSSSRKKYDKEDSKNYTTFEECSNRLSENQKQYNKEFLAYTSESKSFDVNEIVAMVNATYEKKKKRKKVVNQKNINAKRSAFLKEIRKGNLR